MESMNQSNGNMEQTKYNVEVPVVKREPILSILSLVMALLTFIPLILLPVVGLIMCLGIFILAIASLVRKERFIGFAITGLVIGTIFFSLGNLVLLYDLNDDPTEIFSEREFTMGDGSSLYLYADGSYVWYQDKSVQDDNYYSGTYKVFHKEEAEEFINTYRETYAEEATKLGIGDLDTDNLEDFYERNSDSDFYTRENLYCLVMYCDYRFVNGEQVSDEVETIPYMGFSDGDNFDLANMLTGTYIDITNVE